MSAKKELLVRLLLSMPAVVATLSPSNARCEEADGLIRQAVTECLRQEDNALRIACYDNIARNLPNPNEGARLSAKDPATSQGDDNASEPSTNEPSAKTVDMIKPSAPTEYKVVDPADMYVAPGKYMNRAVEMRNVRCFHADANEYRCISNPSAAVLMVLTPKITPSAEQAAIEDQCGEIKKMTTSPKCLKIVRFIPRVHEEDIIGGYQKRVVVVTESVDIAPASPKKKKK